MNIYIVATDRGYIQKNHLHTQEIEHAFFYKTLREAKKEAKRLSSQNPQILEFELVSKGSVPID